MFKAGDKVLCIGMNARYSTKLNVGQTYTVRRTDGKYLYVEGSDADFEQVYFRPVAKPRLALYKVQIKNGYMYRVRCSEEAIKELAEIIGDDHLEGVETVKISKKDKSKTSMKES